MRTSNRRSLLPQPHSRIPDIGSHQSGGAETDVIDSTKTTNKRASVHLSRLERPVSRLTDTSVTSNRPVSRHLTDERLGSNDGAQPTSSSSGLHKRMPSVSQRTTAAHSKSTSNGSTDSSVSHKSVTSRELKTPGVAGRLGRSGTLTRQHGLTSLDTKQPFTRTGTTSSQQQSASPVKSALPKLSSNNLARAGSVVTRDDSATSNMLKAQTELLQLSLMHEEACAALSAYEASAKKKLGERHTYLREMLLEVIVLEQRRAKEVNLEVLSRWLPDPADLLDKLQIVSSIYHETLAFSNDDSEFNKTMSTFQDWILSAEEGLEGEQAQGIKQLPEQWRHAHASTALSVRSLQRQLTQLPVPAKSSLATLMSTCSALLDATLRELDMMTKLETMLLDFDRRRINNAVTVSGLEQSIVTLPPSSMPSWQEVGR